MEKESLNKRPDKQLSKQLNDHRRLVISICSKGDLLNVLKEKMYRTGGSIIKPSGSDPDRLVNNIQIVEDIEAEIACLEDQRRIERKQLSRLSDQLRSDLQRKIIEAYYYCGLSWDETAKLVYQRAHESDKKACREARGRAISEMINMRQ